MKTTLTLASALMCMALPAFAAETTSAEMNDAEMHNEQTMGNDTAPMSNGTMAMHNGSGMMHGDHAAKMEMKGDMMFNKMDTNGDGKISKEEHAAFFAKKFDEADANHDGYVTKDEMDAMHKREWQHMHDHMGMKPGMSNSTMTNSTK